MYFTENPNEIEYQPPPKHNVMQSNMSNKDLFDQSFLSFIAFLKKIVEIRIFFTSFSGIYHLFIDSSMALIKSENKIFLKNVVG